MTVSISSKLWELYGAGKFLPVLKTCELGSALEALALEAVQQSETIPDCPACEAASQIFEPIQSFLDLPPEIEWNRLIQHLNSILERVSQMSDEAFHCHDRQIFHHPDWRPIRDEARIALGVLEWAALREYAEDLQVTCRKALENC